MAEQTTTRQVGPWMLRERLPVGARLNEGETPLEGEAAPRPYRIMLLLHGWTGDENAMWIFARRLPADYWLVAPRAPYPAPGGGYSWHPHQAGQWSRVEDFRPAVSALVDLLTLENFPHADSTRLYLVGFSQGAALAYTFALMHPQRVLSLAGLAGFLPDGAMPYLLGQPLAGKVVFITHGTQDTLVPVERARKAAELFEAAGAEVRYCEDDVGHKLSADCFYALEDFYLSGATRLRPG